MNQMVWNLAWAKGFVANENECVDLDTNVIDCGGWTKGDNGVL